MEKNNSKPNQDLTILDLWYIFKNNLLLIIISSIFCFLLFFIYSTYVLTPNYLSGADVMIQVEQDQSVSNNNDFDLVNAFRLIDTVAELMEKDIVLSNAVSRLEALGYDSVDTSYIRDGLLVSSSSTSYFINISYVDVDKEFSRDTVDSVIDAVIEITDVENAFPVLTNKIKRTSFSSEAVYHSPNKLAYSITGILLGALISFGYAIFKEVLSTEFRNKEEVENLLDLQVLGIIPWMNIKEVKNEKK